MLFIGLRSGFMFEDLTWSYTLVPQRRAVPRGKSIWLACNKTKASLRVVLHQDWWASSFLGHGQLPPSPTHGGPMPSTSEGHSSKAFSQMVEQGIFGLVALRWLVSGPLSDHRGLLSSLISGEGLFRLTVWSSKLSRLKEWAISQIWRGLCGSILNYTIIFVFKWLIKTYLMHPLDFSMGN